jgi:hypothetical protein
MNNYPAPWKLSGYGYILLYRFGTEFSNQQGPDFLKGKAVAGFGSVMLVNYETSNCGPYGELLIIPGRYKYMEEKLHTISRIYVSSQDSVENGRANWGIPKELANFTFEPLAKGLERVTVTNAASPSSAPIFEATFKSGIVPFPVNTSLLPFPLLQHLDGKAYQTTFMGKGIGRLATMTDLKINDEMFPDLTGIKPIAILRVSPFQITFPVAKIR